MAINPVDENGVPMARRDLTTLTPLDDQLREILGPLAVDVEPHYEGLIFTTSDLLLPPSSGMGASQWRGIFARELYRAATDNRLLMNRTLVAHANRNQHVLVWHFDWQLATDLRSQVCMLEETLMAAVAGGAGNFWATLGVWRSDHTVSYRREQTQSVAAVSAYLKEL